MATPASDERRPTNRVRTESFKYCGVVVQLSDETRKQIKMAASATVSDLKAKVKEFETGEFELVHDMGNPLDMNELVSEICERLIRVSTTFVYVDIEGKECMLKIISGEIKFQTFVQKLSENSSFNMDDLERYNYHCKGCQRCITKEKEAFQLLECPCCDKRSLTLKAIANITRISQQVQTLQTNVKLMLFYWPNEFIPNERDPQIEEISCYDWQQFSHLKCHIVVSVENGHASFESVRFGLEQLSHQSRIISLKQTKGKIQEDGKEYVLATSSGNDELQKDERQREYVDCFGVVAAPNAFKPFSYELTKDDTVLICGGERRTVLQVCTI